MPLLCGGTGLYVESVLKGIHLPEVPADPELRARLEGKSLEELTAILSEMKSLHNTTDVDTAKRAIRAIEIETFYSHHPDAAAQAAPSPRTDAVVVGVAIDRESRRLRISARLQARIEAGMTQEVESLLARGVPPEDLMYYGLEYKYVTQYVTGLITFQDMHKSLETAIHQFAKRQMTWFRGMERRGRRVHWLPHDLPSQEFVAEVKRLLDEHA